MAHGMPLRTATPKQCMNTAPLTQLVGYMTEAQEFTRDHIMTDMIASSDERFRIACIGINRFDDRRHDCILPATFANL